MSQRKRILIVEPEPRVRALIERALVKYLVESVPDGAEALARIETRAPDLVLLDLALPQHDGLDVCYRMRQASSTPIIVFTAAESNGDMTEALRLGAHDFLSAPLNVEELRARVQRALDQQVAVPPPQARVLRVGALEIDLQSQTVMRNGQLVPLSRTDWTLLSFLVRHAGQILPHRMILQHVWGDAYSHELGYLRSYVKRLRDVLEDDPKNPHYLQTESRLGYRFAVPDPPPSRASPSAGTSMIPQAAAPLSQMPMPLTSFVGRESEVAAIKALLQRADMRLLTLIGLGGVGKTRLAVQVGMEVAPPFQVCFVDLSHIRAATSVASAIAAALNVKDHGDDGLLERVKEALRSQAYLLILDNFEHVLAGAQVVSELLRSAPALKILVTSRSPLHISGEHEFPVLPLALPDRSVPLPPEELAQLPVVALFIERAQAVKPDFQLTAETAPAVAEICVGLDGLPLAIELAAARIKVLSPQTIAPRLTHRLALLTGGPRDLPARQQTLRSLLDWSYDLVDPAYQPLFARLAVFVDGGTLVAIESICVVSGEGSIELLDGLAALVDASLLQQVDDGSGDVRFVMLATIREYASELLKRSGEDEHIRQQHMHYYLSLAEVAAVALQRMHHRQWLDRLERDHDNLRAALQWALDRRQSEILARFVAALWQFWHVHSHRREAYRWVEAALAQHAALPLPLRARALYGAGWLAYDRREYEQATAYFTESLAALRALDDRLGVSEALRGLGEVALSQADFACAQPLFDESLALSSALGHTLGRAWSLHHLGRIAFEQGQYAQAATVLGESCALFDGIGDKAGIAWSLHSLGRVALDQRRYEQADHWLSDSLVLFCELGDKAGRAWSLLNLGRSALEQGLPDQALRLQRESLAFFRDVGDQKGTGWALHGIGRATAAGGDRQAAIALFEESLVYFRKVSDAIGIEQALSECGQAAAQ
ncbi:MAG TPA: tetratricopeptide repeat protein [Herpetosiphonaceae bacterium]